MRELTAVLVAPILRATGYRFSKEWRRSDSGYRAFVFKYILNTTGANIRAGS